MGEETVAPPEGEIEVPPEAGDEGTPTPEATPPEPETISIEEHKKLQGRLAWAERELRRQQRAQEPPPEKPAEAKGKPKASDYDDYNDYVEALTDWKVENLRKEQTKKHETETRQQKFNRHDEMVSKELAKDPEFRNKAFIPVGLEDVIFDCDNWAQIALYLGEHFDEATNLMNLSQSNPIQAAREIGKLEIKLTNPPQRTDTKAPSPTKTVGGGESAGKKPEDMTPSEYKAWRSSGGGK
jgi:hypothetical protein